MVTSCFNYHIDVTDGEREDPEDRANLNDVDQWTNTQVEAWHGVTFSGEQDDDTRSVSRATRSVTPYAFHEEEGASVINGDEDQASLIDDEPASVNGADDERPPFEDDGEETVGDALRAASDRHEVLLHEIINRLDDIEVATNGNRIRDVTNGLNQLSTTVHENFAMVQDTLQEILRERRLLVQLVAHLNHIVMLK